MLERLIAEVEAQAQSENISSERFVREQRILDELSPRLWQSLRAALKANCEKYPKHFTFEVRPDIEAVVRGANRKVLNVEYLRASKSVIFQCGEVEGQFLIRLNSQSCGVICDISGTPLGSSEHVAEQMLELILK